MFQNRKIIIATKHEKEKVIAPVLERELGVICFTDKNFDTDIFGTFTGEVERTLDPIATAREKCLKAMEANNCDLGIASEGSFGAHPAIFFVPADDEFLIFIDKKNGLEIIAKELSTDTNYNSTEIKNEDELWSFADMAGFPEHGLILRQSADIKFEIFKGINDVKLLKEIFHKMMSKYPTVFVETDMRAMYNPTRMKVIEKATQKLVKKIKSTCPQCHTPGFDITEIKKGLICGLCKMPTNSTLSHIFTCQKCQFTKEEKYPHNKISEDPMYCNFCNP